MKVVIYQLIILVLLASCGQMTSSKQVNQPPITQAGKDT
jgi:hypothetical protein